MSTIESTAQKSSVLTELDYTERTRKRAEWEAFAFEIPSENQIRVINESHADPSDHTYSITVEQRPNSTIVPIHCDCPAFMHLSGACKHMVAAAIRRVVLGAAIAYRRDPDTDPSEPVVLADGGHVIPDDTEVEDDAAECDEEWCPGPDADELPCFECFRDK